MSRGGRRFGSGRKRRYAIDPSANVALLRRHFDTQPDNRRTQDHRAVFALRLRGAAVAEIAVVLGVSPNEVASDFKEELEIARAMASVISVDRLFIAADEGSVRAKIYLFERMRAEDHRI